jgi:hypothetical protein
MFHNLMVKLKKKKGIKEGEEREYIMLDNYILYVGSKNLFRS